MTTAHLRQLDKQHIWHPFTPMKLWGESDPLVITGGEGMYLIDSDGNRYLDGVSSLWCNVHGHRVPEIDQAIRAQLEKVAHSTMLGLTNEPAIHLADRLMKIVPKGLTKIFYSDSGATATEIAFKMAAQYWYNVGNPEKNEFIGFADAYHGDTVGAMSIGRMPTFHRPYFPLLFKVHFAAVPRAKHPHPNPLPEGEGTAERPGFRGEGTGMQPPLPSGEGSPKPPLPPGEGWGEGVRELRSILEQRANRIAAICIEPVVQGAGGMLIQPPGFLREVRRLADEFEVLLICDEVATGFGRTGRMFACEHEDVSPDLMCVAKGISGGYLPLAATFATRRIFDAFLGDPSEGKTFYHGHTYTGNALSCAAAIASLELFEKNDVVRRVQEKSQQLSEMLVDVSRLDHVADVRQKGFMVGIELCERKATPPIPSPGNPEEGQGEGLPISGAKRPSPNPLPDYRERGTKAVPFDPQLRMGARICERIRRHGVILRPLGDVIILMPPLAMEIDDLHRIVQAVKVEVEKGRSK